MSAAATDALRIRAGSALDAEHVLGPVEVSVRNGRIERVDPPSAEGQAGTPDGTEPGAVVGGSDYLLMPGWVNTHTHLSLSLLAGVGADRPLSSWLTDAIWPAEARMTPDDVELGARLAIATSLLSGTTTVHDMYFFEASVERAARDLGIRGVLSVGLVGQGEAFREKLRVAADLVEGMERRSEGRLRGSLGPHAPYTCPPDSLREVAKTAEARGLGIHIHLSETRTEVSDAEGTYGLTPIALAEQAGLFDVPCVAAHVVWPKSTDAEILARHGTGVAHCPTSNLWLGSGIAPVRDLCEAGVRVTLGTDSAASSPGLSMMEVARTAWLLAKGRGEDPTWPRARDVFAWGTVEGARALGYADLGLIAPGQRADLVLLRTGRAERLPLSDDPYLDVIGLLDSRDVDTVVVDGELRVRDGKLLDVDLDGLARESKERARALRQG